MYFKVGDKVRVKSGLVPDRAYHGLYFDSEMKKHIGEIFIIKEMDSDGDVYFDGFAYNESMLEPVIENEQVDHPSHYNHGGLETIDKMRIMFGDEAVKTFCRLNAFKYIDRADYKENKEQDLQKAEWYLNYVKNMEEKDND